MSHHDILLTNYYNDDQSYMYIKSKNPSYAPYFNLNIETLKKKMKTLSSTQTNLFPNQFHINKYPE